MKCRSQRNPTAAPGRPTSPGGASTGWRFCTTSPPPCPMSPPCQDQGSQTTSAQQQSGSMLHPTPAPCPECHKGRGHPGIQEMPREARQDEQPGKVWLPCIDGSLGEGVRSVQPGSRVRQAHVLDDVWCLPLQELLSLAGFVQRSCCLSLR